MDQLELRICRMMGNSQLMSGHKGSFVPMFGLQADPDVFKLLQETHQE